MAAQSAAPVRRSIPMAPSAWHSDARWSDTWPRPDSPDTWLDDLSQLLESVHAELNGDHPNFNNLVPHGVPDSGNGWIDALPSYHFPDLRELWNDEHQNRNNARREDYPRPPYENEFYDQAQGQRQDQRILQAARRRPGDARSFSSVFEPDGAVFGNVRAHANTTPARPSAASPGGLYSSDIPSGQFGTIGAITRLTGSRHVAGGIAHPPARSNNGRPTASSACPLYDYSSVRSGANPRAPNRQIVTEDFSRPPPGFIPSSRICAVQPRLALPAAPSGQHSAAMTAQSGRLSAFVGGNDPFSLFTASNSRSAAPRDAIASSLGAVNGTRRNGPMRGYSGGTAPTQNSGSSGDLGVTFCPNAAAPMTSAQSGRQNVPVGFGRLVGGNSGLFSASDAAAGVCRTGRNEMSGDAAPTLPRNGGPSRDLILRHNNMSVTSASNVFNYSPSAVSGNSSQAKSPSSQGAIRRLSNAEDDRYGLPWATSAGEWGDNAGFYSTPVAEHGNRARDVRGFDTAYAANDTQAAASSGTVPRPSGWHDTQSFGANSITPPVFPGAVAPAPAFARNVVLVGDITSNFPFGMGSSDSLRENWYLIGQRGQICMPVREQGAVKSGIRICLGIIQAILVLLGAFNGYVLTVFTETAEGRAETSVKVDRTEVISHSGPPFSHMTFLGVTLTDLLYIKENMSPPLNVLGLAVACTFRRGNRRISSDILSTILKSAAACSFLRENPAHLTSFERLLSQQQLCEAGAQDLFWSFEATLVVADHYNRLISGHGSLRESRRLLKGLYSSRYASRLHCVDLSIENPSIQLIYLQLALLMRRWIVEADSRPRKSKGKTRKN